MNFLYIILTACLLTVPAFADDVAFITTELPQAYDELDLACHQRNVFFGFRCPVVDARVFDPSASQKDVVKSMLKKFGHTAKPSDTATFITRLEETLQIQLDYVTRFEGRGREDVVGRLKDTLGGYLAFLAGQGEAADLIFVDAFGSWSMNLNAGTYYLVYLSQGKLFKIDHGQ